MYSFKPLEDEDKKCAAGRQPTDGTCFTIEQLTKLAKGYNSTVKEDDKKIEIKNDKKYLLKELVDKLPKTCKDQLCILKEKYVNNIDNFDILYNTFRPKGPTYKFKWLSTSNINQIMIQYQEDPNYKDFIFLGAVPLDFQEINIPINFKKNGFNTFLNNLYNDNIKKIGIVFNLDKHYEPGSHWVASYADIEKNQVYFFDSYGKKPEKEIYQYITKIMDWIINKKNIQKKEIDYRHNTVRHQFKNSECGVYSCNFIIRLLKGETFENITSNITLDDKINTCRQKYFRFK